MKETRTCKTCGQEFEAYPSAKKQTCSVACRNTLAGKKKRAAARENRICAVCGKIFEIIQSRHDKCCSRECGDIKRRQTCAARPPKPPKEPKIKHCITCGAEIVSQGPAKWCLSCRKNGRRETARKYYHTQQYKEAHRRLAVEWQRRNPAKQYASRMARKHPELLIIIYECTCDTNGNGKHHHHFDYSRPYEVLKLCADCHAAEHARLRALAAQAAQNSPPEFVEETPVNVTPTTAHMPHRAEIAGEVHADTGTC